MGLFNKHKSPWEIVDEGKHLYTYGKYKKAVRVLEEGSGTWNGQADYWIARCYRCMEDPDMEKKYLTLAANRGHKIATWMLICLYPGTHVISAKEALIKGNEAFQNQRYDEAARWWENAETLGSGEAMMLSGLLYEKGLGVKQDMREALWRYRRAADMGDIKAMCLAANIYNTGADNVAKDLVRAVDMYRRAAMRNYDVAQFNLAAKYLHGEGVKKNPEKAIKWLCQCGLHKGEVGEKAKDILRKMSPQLVAMDAKRKEGESYYEQGAAANKKKDYPTAIRYWELAAERGNENAYKRLYCGSEEKVEARVDKYHPVNTIAVMPTSERLEYVNYNKAVAWDQRAMEQEIETTEESAIAYSRTGKIKEAIDTARKAAEEERGYEWRLMILYEYTGEYTEAAFWGAQYDRKMGGKKAENHMQRWQDSFLLTKALEKENYQDVRKLVEKGSAYGDGNCMYLYGFLYANGLGGLRVNTEEAHKWYRRAAEKGNCLGQLCYAECCYDCIESLYWYEQAASQDLAEAQNKCGEMYKMGRGLMQDKNRALYWYNRSAEQNDPEGLVECANLLWEGADNINDREIARKYYQQAAAQTENKKMQEAAKEKLAQYWGIRR